MSGLFGKLAMRFLKGKWGSVLPALLRAVAEGKFGEPARKFYWATAGAKTITGAILVAVGAGLASLCSSGGEVYPWACSAQPYVITLGGLLASVGLVDGGVRSPWPNGTPKADD